MFFSVSQSMVWEPVGVPKTILGSSWGQNYFHNINNNAFYVVLKFAMMMQKQW